MIQFCFFFYQSVNRFCLFPEKQGSHWMTSCFRRPIWRLPQGCRKEPVLISPWAQIQFQVLCLILYFVGKIRCRADIRHWVLVTFTIDGTFPSLHFLSLILVIFATAYQTSFYCPTAFSFQSLLIGGWQLHGLLWFMLTLDCNKGYCYSAWTK